jgi:hypothetical protein
MSKPLNAEQQLLLARYLQADDAFRNATHAYWQAHEAQVKACDSERLKAFNAQRCALDAQVKAFKWQRRHYQICLAADFNPLSHQNPTVNRNRED